MDDFERQMDNVRVQGACMDAALGSAVASTTPPDEVNALMQQVADAHGLQIAQAMPAPSLAASQDFATATASPSSDPLAERLAKLRS
jgi:charged multivesicular body protein 1